MLAGEMGEYKQKALQFIVNYAQVLGAQELCEVSRATLFIGAQHYLDCYGDDVDYKKIFSEFYLCSDTEVELGRVACNCKTQTCISCCDSYEDTRTHLSPQFHARNRRYLETIKQMGINVVDSCTPYYVGWVPMMGEHYVTTESSNVVISNSIFGACGNSDGVEAAVCAAISGRIPKWGMHVPEQRYGTCLFTLDFEVSTMMEWDLLGFTLGRLLPKHEKPVILNGLMNVEINRMRQLCASLSVTSAAEICHIVGHTPEPVRWIWRWADKSRNTRLRYAARTWKRHWPCSAKAAAARSISSALAAHMWPWMKFANMRNTWRAGNCRPV